MTLSSSAKTQLLPGVMVQQDGGGYNTGGSTNLAGEARNFSVASQTPAATVRTQIAGSLLAIPKEGYKVGTLLRWKFNITKTAAGTATSVIDVSFGLAGTVADTAQLSFTKPAGTAAADEGTIEVECLVKAIGAAGAVVGEFTMTHNLATTGHMAQQQAIIQVTSAAFDPNSGTQAGGANSYPAYVALNITTGAADAVTITMVQAYAWFF